MFWEMIRRSRFTVVTCSPMLNIYCDVISIHVHQVLFLGYSGHNMWYM